MGANAINLLFNAYLGRVVSVVDFGIIGLINTFLYFGSLFYNALLSTVNYQVSHLETSSSVLQANNFYIYTLKQVLLISSVIAVIWLIISPLTAGFFQISQPQIFYFFTPLIVIYPLVFLGKGYFQARLFFVSTAILSVLEPVVKLTSAWLLIHFFQPSLAYLSIYLSTVVTGLTAFFWIKTQPLSSSFPSVTFPWPFFIAALLNGVSNISFLVLDMVLVKHFLTPSQAGNYAFLSLLGKIIYFLGSLLNVFTISLISREATNKRHPLVSFSLLFTGAALLIGIACLVFGVFSTISIPLIFSNKANGIISYALPYTAAIGLFTLGNIITTYHLAKKNYLFPLSSILISVFVLLGIWFYHQTIAEIVSILLIVGVVSTILLAVAHFWNHLTSPKIATESLEPHLEETIP